jgi:hypothetical protein
MNTERETAWTNAKSRSLTRRSKRLPSSVASARPEEVRAASLDGLWRSQPSAHDCQCGDQWGRSDSVLPPPVLLPRFGIKQLRPGTQFRQLVPGITQRTDSERKATAPNATIQLIAKSGQSHNSIAQVGFPSRRHLLPVLRRRHAPARQRGHRVAY